MDNLKEYAELTVRVGINAQPGQTVVIYSSIECAYFARVLAAACYDAGAREVVMRWDDDEISKMHYLRAADAVFDEVPAWYKEFHDFHAAQGSGLIRISAADPDLLKEASPDRIKRWSIAAGTALKDYKDKQMNNEFPWCIVCAPSKAWAKKVFPDLDADDAVAKLWDIIYKVTHVGGGGALAKWEKKLVDMTKRADALTALGLGKLVFKNSLGTNLEVGLAERHKWICAGEKTSKALPFVANIPTEEMFTTPKRGEASGVVCASLPLSLNGNLVNDIVLTFEDGKVVDAKATSGLEFLKNELDLDEGARYLGEVALVPFHSPISELGILFYKTLIDENASCHFALGKAYPCFTDAEEASKEDLAARGMNDSLTHVDFMFGTPDLSIVGIMPDGSEVPVFVDGDFAAIR
jgi:aminopeptidase